jgi:hypothetical protein
MTAATATRPSAGTIVPAVVKLALAQHGLIHRRQLRDLGTSRSRTRRLVAQGFLRPLVPNVFVVGAARSTWEQELMSGVLQLGPSALVSSQAAAALHRFDTFRRGPLCFLVPPQQRSILRAGRVRSSSAPLTDDDLDAVDGIPCTSPARTIFDLASVVSRRRLEHAIDSGLRDGQFTDADLIRILTRLRERGRNGVSRMEEALAIAEGPAVHSVLERRFLRLVAESGLPVPTSQVVFLDGEERFVARVDFLFEDLVIVEVEGHRFHSTRSQRQRDNERRNRLSRSEHRFLAFTYEDVRDRPRYVAREVRAALAAARRRAS